MATSGQKTGVALATAGVGLVLAWSGLFNKKITATIQDVVTGKKPVAGPGGQLPSGFVSGDTAVSSVGNTFGNSVPVVPASGPGQTAFFTAVLLSLGAPPTPANLHSLNAWYAREEPSWPPFCTNNPFNTEVHFPGVTGICPTTSAVLEFGSEAAGIAATVGSINQIAPDVAGALRTGKGLCGQDFKGLYDWSGHSYSSVC